MLILVSFLSFNFRFEISMSVCILQRIMLRYSQCPERECKAETVVALLKKISV